MSPRYITIAALLLAGCSFPLLPTLPGLKPYKMDVQQGNVVTQEMIAKVQPGMTRNQVRFALGTPLVVDPFRNDRWDYVYFYQKGGVTTEQRRIAVIFKDDKLVRIDGDVVPAGAGGTKPAAAKMDKPVAPAPAAVPQAQPEMK
jgi:outer membrane protein assembly factor BamE